jgi:hypothetical protein
MRPLKQRFLLALAFKGVQVLFNRKRTSLYQQSRKLKAYQNNIGYFQIMFIGFSPCFLYMIWDGVFPVPLGYKPHYDGFIIEGESGTIIALLVFSSALLWYVNTIKYDYMSCKSTFQKCLMVIAPFVLAANIITVYFELLTIGIIFSLLFFFMYVCMYVWGVSQLMTNYLRPNKTTFFGNSTASL